MISQQGLIAQLPRLPQQDLEGCIAWEWLRADGGPGRYVFREIDVARVRLILELRDDVTGGSPRAPVSVQRW